MLAIPQRATQSHVLVGGALFLFHSLEGLAVLVVGILVEDAQVAGEA